MRHHTDRYRVCEAVRDYALDPVIGIVSGSERKEQAVGMLRWIFEENAGVAAAFSAEEYKVMISQEETGRKDDGKNV